MRQWLVDPAILCRKHLTGEHVEMHMFMGTIRAKKSLNGYIRNNLVQVPLIVLRHNKLAAEMRKRGMNHKSPLFFEDASYLPSFVLSYKVDREKAKQDLLSRCPECKSNYEARYGKEAL